MFHLGTDGDDESEESDIDISAEKLRKKSSRQSSQQGFLSHQSVVNTAPIQRSVLNEEELKQSLTQLLNSSGTATSEDMDDISRANSSSASGSKMVSVEPDEAWVEVNNYFVCYISVPRLVSMPRKLKITLF